MIPHLSSQARLCKTVTRAVLANGCSFSLSCVSLYYHHTSALGFTMPTSTPMTRRQTWTRCRTSTKRRGSLSPETAGAKILPPTWAPAYDMPAAAAELADVRSSMVSSPSSARTHHQIAAASTRSAVTFAAITPAAKMPKRVGFNQSVYVLLIPSYQDLGERERADRWWSARELWQFRCSYYQHLVTETQGAAVQC
eukprot:TRINITY_DN21315_c0_g1_i1.p1 TRINITY_DN21315_c0_g1~~TRINITY_DN21315_c0_g1_i1.p1  ORF type:complete len:196 (-),score=18.00 TRINITY_DN21315_c0_g1_i1:464-1051(-)